MVLYARDVAILRQIISLAEKLIAETPKAKRGRPAVHRTNFGNEAAKQKRVRRTGKELAKFRKTLKVERRKGVTVAELARKHNVSTAYIYGLR